MREKIFADEIDSIIPISDNGGSSSELIRVFGGPGIGDVRSMFLFFSFFIQCYKWETKSRILLLYTKVGEASHFGTPFKYIVTCRN
jgi:hypothetical protein